MSGEPFAHRGIVEGFYGPPWAHEDRRWWIDQLAALGLNRYVIAPKDDPFHRERFREPYPADALDQFGELIDHGRRREVEVGLALSPGLGLTYSDPADVEAVVAKLAALHGVGARWLALCLDDVPAALQSDADRARFESLAAAHLALLAGIRDALPDTTIWFVPTDYAGTAASHYLEVIAGGLPSDVEVAWTGGSVLPATIRCDEARRRSEALGRKLLVWDNVPVADGPMRTMLHLGGYEGREAGLERWCSGVLLNPMQRARASYLTIATAAAWMRDPAGYAPEEAWGQAARALGAGAPEAFALFAAAHRTGLARPDDRDAELEAAWRRARSALGSPDAAVALAALSDALEARAEATATLATQLDDARLREELGPWLAAHAAETERMRAAVDGLRALAEPAPAAIDHFHAMLRFQGRLTRHPPGAVTSYGPRRAFYPKLEALADDGVRFAAEPVFWRDRCLADDVVRAAEDHMLAVLGGRRA